MPHFDTSISIGNILTATGAVFALIRYISHRIQGFEDVLREHSRTLVAHAERMEKQDDLLFKLVGDVQRLIGRMEAETLRRSG